MLDSREWIVPDGATSSTTDALETVIEKNLISLRNIFHCFRLVLAKHIAIETINNEYTSLVIYPIKNINILLQPQRKVWQYLFQVNGVHSRSNIFMLAELFLRSMFKCISPAFLQSNENCKNRLEESIV